MAIEDVPQKGKIELSDVSKIEKTKEHRIGYESASREKVAKLFLQESTLLKKIPPETLTPLERDAFVLVVEHHFSAVRALRELKLISGYLNAAEFKSKLLVLYQLIDSVIKKVRNCNALNGKEKKVFDDSVTFYRLTLENIKKQRK